MGLTLEEQAELDALKSEKQSGYSGDSGANYAEDPRFAGLTLDERHPDISGFDRFMVKNLNAPAEQQKKYLQTKYPDLDIEVQAPNDEIIVKRKDEQAWKKLDPDRWEFEDITDVAPDIAQAGAESYAAIKGGALGAKAGVKGALALGSASAAGVAGGANLLRQKLRQHLGMQEAVQPGEAALETAIPMITTPFLGTGAGAVKGLAKKEIEAQRGLLSRGAEFAKDELVERYPKLVEFFTGGELPKEVVETYMTRAGRAEVDPLMQNTPESLAKLKTSEAAAETAIPKVTPGFPHTPEEEVLQYVQKAAEDTRKEFYNYKNEVGGRLGKMLDSSKKPTDIGSTKRVILDYIDEMSRRPDASSVKVQEMIQTARNILDGPESPFAQIVPIMDREEIVARALERATPDQATQILKLRKPGTLKETQLREAYAAARRLFPEGFTTIQSFPDKVHTRVAHTIRKTIEDDLDVLRKTSPSDYRPRYGKNATWEKKVLTDLYNKMRRDMQKNLGKTLGKDFDTYNKLYQKVYEAENILDKNIGTDEQFINTMSDYYTKKNPGMTEFRAIHEDIRRKTGGTFDLEGTAKVLSTAKLMRNPTMFQKSWMPAGAGLTGSLIGAVTGGTYAAGAAGALVASALTSPKAAKMAIKAAHLMQDVANKPALKKARELSGPGGLAIWNMMSEQEKKVLADYLGEGE
jgi:hypothetical protein